jgi:hypothetical protein
VLWRPWVNSWEVGASSLPIAGWKWLVASGIIEINHVPSWLVTACPAELPLNWWVFSIRGSLRESPWLTTSNTSPPPSSYGIASSWPSGVALPRDSLRVAGGLTDLSFHPELALPPGLVVSCLAAVSFFLKASCFSFKTPLSYWHCFSIGGTFSSVTAATVLSLST